MLGEKNLSVLPKFMSKKLNLLNFDKEVALSIGLNEAIVLQLLKTKTKHSLSLLINKLSFIEEKEIQRVLKKLLKLKLIEETSKEIFCLKSKSEKITPERKQIISKGYFPSNNILKLFLMSSKSSFSNSILLLALNPLYGLEVLPG